MAPYVLIDRRHAFVRLTRKEQSAMSTHASHPHTAQSRDATDIGALYQQLLDSWNQRNTATYAALFAEDASVVGFDSNQINGRAEIATQIGQIFADHPTSRYVGKVRE